MHVTEACLPIAPEERQVRETILEIDRGHMTTEVPAEHTARLIARCAAAVDHPTADHVRRVGALAGEIARALGWSDAEIEAIRIAATLHDVGKVALPAPILTHSGPLSSADWALMRLHTGVAARIFRGVTHPLLVLARDIATTHHERWDGAGYLHELSGEEIPPAARLVSVADTFDAITNNRAYRSGQSDTVACQIILDERDAQFEPRAVDALLGLPAQTRMHP